VVGGALAVEAEDLRTRPEQRRRIPQAVVALREQRADHLGVELARQLDASNEMRGHGAILPHHPAGRYDAESACLVRSVTRASTAASTASPADRYSAARSPVWNAE
jgi:hypothetical protein